MESIKNRENVTEGCGDGPVRKVMALIPRADVEPDLMGICILGDRRQAESPETHRPGICQAKQENHLKQGRGLSSPLSVCAASSPCPATHTRARAHRHAHTHVHTPHPHKPKIKK